jgi:hypothetical protein
LAAGAGVAPGGVAAAGFGAGAGAGRAVASGAALRPADDSPAGRAAPGSPDVAGAAG